MVLFLYSAPLACIRTFSFLNRRLLSWVKCTQLKPSSRIKGIYIIAYIKLNNIQTLTCWKNISLLCYFRFISNHFQIWHGATFTSYWILMTFYAYHPFPHHHIYIEKFFIWCSVAIKKGKPRSYYIRMPTAYEMIFSDIKWAQGS